MKKQIILIGTKGGGGKSMFSTMVAPLFYIGKIINIYELDNNNVPAFESSESFRLINLKVNKADEVIDELDFSKIVDCGGGDDSIAVLNSIQKSSIQGLTYILPLNDDIEQMHNIEEIIYKIKKADPKASISIVLNRVSIMSKEDIHKQFVGVFGSEKYGIEGKVDELLEIIDGIYYVRNSPIFSILKNLYKSTLVDSYIFAKDIVENIEEYKKDWAGEGKEYFNKQMSRYRFAKDVISLVEELQSMKKIFIG